MRTDSVFDDTEQAFRHQSTLELCRRGFVLWTMGRPMLAAMGQRAILDNIQNPLGQLLCHLGFELFIGGQTLKDVGRSLDDLARHQVGGIIDYLVEGGTRAKIHQETLQQVLKGIAFASAHAARPVVACKLSGLADIDVLRRAQAGEVLGTQAQRSLEAARERLFKLCQAAAKQDVTLFVDAEYIDTQTLIDDWCLAAMREFNRARPVVYTTLQMYRKDRGAYLEELMALARREAWWLGVKLVRGAYLEHERTHNQPDPIHERIEDTHRAYDQAVARCIAERERVAVNIATHNRVSVERAVELVRAEGIALDDPRVGFSQLKGMGDFLSFPLAALGARVAKYLPYGPLHEAVPYLIRRQEENTAIKGQSTRELEILRKELYRRLAGKNG